MIHTRAVMLKRLYDRCHMAFCGRGRDRGSSRCNGLMSLCLIILSGKNSDTPCSGKSGPLLCPSVA